MSLLAHISSSLVLVALLISPIQGDLVACIGEDGHQEIEISSMGNCFSCLGSDEHDAAFPQPPVDADHCGDCTDIPLTTHPAQAQKKTVFFDAPGPAARTLTWPLFVVKQPLADPTFLPNPPPLNAVVESLKTIILLI